jgi:hypothetical protein
MERDLWSLFDSTKPWTANAERTWHHHRRAAEVKACRSRFYYLTLQAKVPPLDQIVVIAQPFRKDRRSMPDVAACYPTVKAAIDGIVDARVVPDDSPKHLIGLVFMAPEIIGSEGLCLRIAGPSHPIHDLFRNLPNTP